MSYARWSFLLFASVSLIGVIPGAFALEEAGADADRIVAHLKQRRERLESLSAIFRRRRVPTEKFVSVYAKQHNKSMESTRIQFSMDVEGQFVERKDGIYRGEETTWRLGRQTATKSIVMYDGKTTWLLTNQLFEDGNWSSPSIQLNGDVAVRYAGAAEARKVIGDTVLQGGKFAIGGIIDEGGKIEHVGSEVVNEVACDIVRTHKTRDGKTPYLRKTYWLDRERGYVCLRHTVERKAKEGAGWDRFEEWTASRVGKVVVDGNGTTFDYFYPEVVDRISWNSALNFKIADDQIQILKLTINAKLDPAILKMEIEDGTNMSDLATKKAWVYGNGPSKRLQKQIDRRIAEAKKVEEDISKLIPAGVRKETSMTNSSGFLGLLIAAFLSSVTCGVILFRRRR